MNELMYSINSSPIAVVLLVSMLIAMKVGVRIGHRTMAASLALRAVRRPNRQRAPTCPR